ncbi:MAG: hypothetical protein ACREO4_06430 [Lysobacter sp.]
MADAISIDEAFRVAEQASPLPQRAHEALQVLKSEVLLRWEQRTALSFRLQDLRDAAAAAGIPDDSPLYGAIHDATATAEAWMHPGTLSDAAQTHLARLKRQLAELVASRADDWLTMESHPERTTCLLWHPAWAEPCVGAFVPEFNEWCDEERVPHPQPMFWQPLPSLPGAEQEQDHG